jgi:hypothetical protein
MCFSSPAFARQRPALDRHRQDEPAPPALAAPLPPRAPNLRKARRHRARRRVSGYFETRLWLTVLSATTESQNAVTERTANNQLRARGATPTTDVSPHGQSWPCFGRERLPRRPKGQQPCLGKSGEKCLDCFGSAEPRHIPGWADNPKVVGSNPTRDLNHAYHSCRPTPTRIESRVSFPGRPWQEARSQAQADRI